MGGILESSDIRSLYIRVPGGYGDNLMATAVVAAVKREYPDMRIFVATKRLDIFENNPHIAGLYNTRTLLKKNMSIYNRCCVLEYVPYAKKIILKTLVLWTSARWFTKYEKNYKPVKVAFVKIILRLVRSILKLRKIRS